MALPGLQKFLCEQNHADDVRYFPFSQTADIDEVSVHPNIAQQFSRLQIQTFSIWIQLFNLFLA